MSPNNGIGVIYNLIIAVGSSVSTIIIYEEDLINAYNYNYNYYYYYYYYAVPSGNVGN